MKIVDKLLNKISIDKVLHFLVGALLVSIGSMINEIAMFISMCLLYIMSIIKESVDEKFDVKDLMYSLYGGVNMIILYYLIQIFI